jgi:hypothetical protein
MFKEVEELAKEFLELSKNQVSKIKQLSRKNDCTSFQKANIEPCLAF